MSMGFFLLSLQRKIENNLGITTKSYTNVVMQLNAIF